MSKANIEFERLVQEIGTGTPNAHQYKYMSGLVLDFPKSRALSRMSPSDPGYRGAAMRLYLDLRGRSDEGYLAPRDETSNWAVPENLWTELVPWSFKSAKMVSEHLLAWGHMLSELNLPPGGSLLEYGPGSGQVLLIAARLGYRACGVDIDPVALSAIQAQATHLGVNVETEQDEFGQGFAGETFDAVLFYESFHHAFEFENLLSHLHTRLKPGGRVVLCGEPVVDAGSPIVPYPWGPRLDALSVFCIRRFGWMELGFTHDFLVHIARLTGWNVTYHPVPNDIRSTIYVLQESTGEDTPVQVGDKVGLQNQISALRAELTAIQASTSWRITRPLRLIKERLRRAR